jgi:hypothetical protein
MRTRPWEPWTSSLPLINAKTLHEEWPDIAVLGGVGGINYAIEPGKGLSDDRPSTGCPRLVRGNRRASKPPSRIKRIEPFHSRRDQ